MTTVQLVDIGMEDTVDETNTGALVWVLIREFDVNLPETALKRSYQGARLAYTEV